MCFVHRLPEGSLHLVALSRIFIASTEALNGEVAILEILSILLKQGMNWPLAKIVE